MKGKETFVPVSVSTASARFIAARFAQKRRVAGMMAMNNHSFDILCRVLGWRWKRPHDCKVTTSKFIQNNNQGNWKTLMSRISYLGHMNQSQGQRRRTAVSRIPSLRLGLLVAEYKRWIRKKSRVTSLLSDRPTWFDLPKLPHRLNWTQLAQEWFITRNCENAPCWVTL